jgi:hypothetical protein
MCTIGYRFNNGNDRRFAVVRALDARVMTFPDDILHQHAVAGTEHPHFSIAGRHFEVAFQADKKLRLGWIDRFAGPT